MSQFTYLFRGRQASGSPEQRQKHMEKWVAWFKELGAKGHLKDPGHPLEATGKVVNGAGKVVKDGPFAEAKESWAATLWSRRTISLTPRSFPRDVLFWKWEVLSKYGPFRFLNT